MIKIVGYLRRLLEKSYLLDAANLAVVRDEYRRLLENEKYQNPLRLNRFGYSLYSQSDEDGILFEIFRRVGVTNRRFIEFGCGNGLENNTHSLLLAGWSGLWVDGNNTWVSMIRKKFHADIDSGRLVAKHAFITRENINSILCAELSGEIDLLSVDLDGNDWHVVDAIECVSPRVIVLEYNARKGPEIDWVMQYNPRHIWSGSDYYGASLKAFETLLRKKDYSLVGCSISGVNAFFVRNDLADENQFLAPFSSQVHYEPHRMLLRLGVHTSHPRDYGSWISATELLQEGKRYR